MEQWDRTVGIARGVGEVQMKTEQGGHGIECGWLMLHDPNVFRPFFWEEYQPVTVLKVLPCLRITSWIISLLLATTEK